MTRKLLSIPTFVVLTSCAAVGIFLYKQESAQALPPKDLKFFPKNIKQKKLYAEMRKIKAELGVQCNFCHVYAPAKDFAANTKRKKIALKMLHLTKRINDDLKKIFPKGDKKVTCYTCHRGKKIPLNTIPDEDDDEDE